MVSARRQRGNLHYEWARAYGTDRRYTTVRSAAAMNEHKGNGGWIGASMLRREDARHLHGRGMFIADVSIPGVQEVAFVRSQMANARVRRVTKPADSASRVFTLADLGPI